MSYVQTETPSPVILSSKVKGTAVSNAIGERIGHIEDVAIDKVTGQVAYAILSCGGFLGIGERFHPLPWPVLNYDPNANSYVVPLSKEQLKDAPSYTGAELATAGETDAAYRDHVHKHFVPFI